MVKLVKVLMVFCTLLLKVQEYDNESDVNPPVIYTDIFGDYGYEVVFDVRDGIRIWAEDEGGVASLSIYPSYLQNTYVDDVLTPSVTEDTFEINYTYPKGEEYGYVVKAVDIKGNLSTRVIITRYNVTSRMKRVIPRSNYD